MSFPTSWNPFGAFLSCTCWRSELDYASVNAETFCTKDILSQTLCSEDDFRQLPGRRLRPRLRVWSLALMAFLTSSLMCSLPWHAKPGLGEGFFCFSFFLVWMLHQVCCSCSFKSCSIFLGPCPLPGFNVWSGTMPCVRVWLFTPKDPYLEMCYHICAVL